MEITDIIFFIVFSAVAVSYGWGMRGTILGAEKGAMLPGALMGLLIAVFSGSEVLYSSPWLLAGAGALGMFCGGNMTYAETLSFSMKTKPAPNMKKGLIALFIKGGIWFALFGGYLSVFISAISGFYELWQLLLFFTLLPVFAFIFYCVFNKPYDKEKGIYPKIYFSENRKETWGGLLGMLAELIIFTSAFKDWSALAMMLGTFSTGSVGWVIAQLLQINAIHPKKNGKRLFEKLNQKKAVDAWKIMECSYGALGGIGCAVTFLLSKPLFAEKFASLDTNGLHSFVSDKTAVILATAYICLLIFDTIQYFIKPNKENPHFVRYRKFCINTEFAFYCMIPLFLSMLGSHITMALIAFPVIMLVLFQEYAEKEVMRGKGNRIIRFIYLLPCFTVAFMILITEKAVGTFLTAVMYTFLYEAVFFFYQNVRYDSVKLSNSEKTVHTYFIVCCIITVILTFFI